jgi:hypothetical protein
MAPPSPAAIEAAAKFWEFLGHLGTAKVIRERKGFRTTAEVFAQFEEEVTAPLLERITWLSNIAGAATDRGMELERENARLREAFRLFPEAYDTLTNAEMHSAKGNWRSLIDQQSNAIKNALGD